MAATIAVQRKEVEGMRVLVLGGTGFVGRPVVARLTSAGHEVMVFHRGTEPPPRGVWAITGSRHDLDSQRHELRGAWPDVVVDLIAASGRQAAALMRVFRGVAQRLVVASSMDVYRATSVLHRLDEGPLEPTPLTEESTVRANSETYPAAQLQRLIPVFPWLDERYDKLAVERAVANDPELPSTVLRLPMIYGPGDKLHRLRPLLARMSEDRHALVLPESLARWRAPHAFVENVADAIVLAAGSEKAARRTYNVAEPAGKTELEFTEGVARAAGWAGRVVVVPDESAPPRSRAAGNLAQHWDADSSRIRAELSYAEAVSPEEAIVRTVAWERRTPFLPQDLEAYEEEDPIDRR
jgi:nucleoside-diphosphate-sugar epimerase